MKTTYSKAVEAYMTLLRTAKQPVMSLAVAGKLFRLRKALQPLFEFYEETRNGIIDDCGATVDAVGRVAFPDAEAKEKYTAKIAELNAMECEAEITPVQIPETADLKYSPEDLWNLDGFIEIVEKE